MTVKKSRYTIAAIVIHWLMAIGIAANAIIIFSYPSWGDENIRLAIDTHKSIGITLLGFFILRVLWRLINKPPAYPYEQPKLEKLTAKLTHTLLYVLMFMIPLSGWMHDSAWVAAPEVKMYWFGTFEWPRIGWIMAIEPELKKNLHGLFGEIHEWLNYFLFALVFLHIAAALKHHFSPSQPVRGRGILP